MNGQPIPRRVPGVWRVARSQFNLIDTSGRFTLLLAVLGLGAVAPIAMGGGLRDPEFVFPFTPIMLLTIIWPVLVWRGESPKNRTYHRIMPVNHITHDLLKVAAGAVWLMIGVATILLGLLGSILISGWSELISHLTTPAFLSYFTSALILYLMFSVIPILTNRPLEWMLGIGVGAYGLIVIDETYGLGLAKWITRTFVQSELGFAVAFYGGYASQPWAHTLQSTAAMDYINASIWAASTLLWLLFALALVFVASYIANQKQPA